MWEVELQGEEEKRVLIAKRIPSQTAEQAFVATLKMRLSDDSVVIHLKIMGDAAIIERRINTEISRRGVNAEISSKPKEDYLCIKIIVSIKDDYSQFATVFNSINNELPQSDQIERQVAALLSTDRRKGSATHGVLLSQFRRAFEGYHENIMAKTLMASVKQSLGRLKRQYPVLSPREEIDLKIRLINKLSSIQKALIREKFLVDDAEFPAITTVKLSEKSKRLIQTPGTNAKAKDVERAQFAFNVTVAIRAISFGAYSENMGGYNFPSLIAFLYNCCLVAESQDGFAKHVTMRHAMDALINAIAQGAREKARLDDKFDSLEDGDFRSCPEGLNKFLIAGLEGVFPEIKIIYEWLELLLAFLKKEIVRILLQQPACNNLLTASSFINIWNGSELEPSNEQTTHPYNIFKNKIIADFDNMIMRFTDRYFNSDPSTRSAVISEIKAKTYELKTQAFADNYIELVSPSLELLQTMWDEKYAAKTSAEIKRVHESLRGVQGGTDKRARQALHG